MFKERAETLQHVKHRDISRDIIYTKCLLVALQRLLVHLLSLSQLTLVSIEEP
jgi:hypothetical protein